MVQLVQLVRYLFFKSFLRTSRVPSLLQLVR
jgi:hypothetical protein